MKFFKQNQINMFKVLTVLFFIAPVFSNASSISISPQNITVSAGEKFALKVYVDGQGQPSYTSKVGLDFPPSFLAVDKWEFAPNVMSLRQPGYDLLDNSSGKFIRTGGVPEGFTGRMFFGTITFIAKKTGSAKVSLSTDSFVLNESNENSLIQRGNSDITIVEATKKEPIVANEGIKISFNTEIKESDVVMGNSLIVLTNLSLDNATKEPIKAKVNYSVNNSIGLSFIRKSVDLRLTSESATAQKLEIGNLPVGSYFLSTEVLYDGQREPQKIEGVFNIIPPKPQLAEEKEDFYKELTFILGGIIVLMIAWFIFRSRVRHKNIHHVKTD